MLLQHSIASCECQYVPGSPTHDGHFDSVGHHVKGLGAPSELGVDCGLGPLCKDWDVVDRLAPRGVVVQRHDDTVIGGCPRGDGGRQVVGIATSFGREGVLGGLLVENWEGA